MQLNGLGAYSRLRDQGVTNCQQEKHEGMHCMFKPVMISSWIHNYAYKMSSLCCPQSWRCVTRKCRNARTRNDRLLIHLDGHRDFF